MKKLIIPALTAILFMSITACKKESSAPGTGSTSLIASKTNAIKRGEPVFFTLSHSVADSVKWSVSPSLNAQVNATGANASIMFGSGGAYTVTAVAGNLTDSSVVTVLDSVYTPPTASTTLPFTGNEQIKITASKLDSGAYSGLILFAKTVNSYTCLGNYLVSEFIPYDNNYIINFTGVSVPGNCTSGLAKAGTFEYMIPMNDGINTLTIRAFGNTYTGSIVKAGSSYTINWSYTSGVTISPSTL